MRTTADDLHTWASTGTLEVKQFLGADEITRLQAWVDDLATAPTAAGMLHHDETTAQGTRVRCRTENIVPFHAGFKELLTDSAIVAMAGDLLGEPAVLYKEKINYKHPGGAGFAPHQDAHAYPFVTTTIACMIAVDDATPANGCLELAEGFHREPLPTDRAGCIPDEIARTLPWEPKPMQAGSLLWFHHHTPHRSGTNLSSDARRAIYVTYNPASEGDRRSAYYEEKRRVLATDTSTASISLIGHFLGDTVPADGKTTR